MAEKTNAQKAVDVMNMVRSTASSEYQNAVPVATLANLQEVGNPILSYKVLMNEFLDTLVNRIAFTFVHTMVYNNPLSVLKKGSIPLGTDVQEIFTNPATAVSYDMNASTLLSSTVPDVKAAYHRMNRQDQYPVTLTLPVIRKAFTSWDNMETLIASVINSLYSGDNIDEYQLMRNLIGGAVDNDYIVSQTLTAALDDTNAADFVKKVKTASSMMTFPGSSYNAYSAIATAQSAPDTTPVVTWTPKDRQILLIRSDALVTVNVDVLAAAFNLNKVEFMGRVLEVDSFGTGEKSKNTLAILCDEAFVQVYDNLTEMGEFYNAQKMSWNYYWNHWQTYSYSPMVNAIAFLNPGA